MARDIGLLTKFMKVGITMVETPKWPELARGHKGTNVKALQLLLRYRGANISVDGDFGTNTKILKKVNNMAIDVRIKMPANIVYELTNTGNIKAKNLMKVLFENEHISKKKENVIESIENCLCKGREIEKAMYDMLTNEVILRVRW